MRVDGVGRTPNLLLMVGEGPGWQEDKCGEPLVGKTGDEIDRHLDANDLPPREDWFLTNIYRYYGGKDYDWTQADLERDEPSLLKELEEVSPQLIVTLGRHATRYFLGDVDLDSTQGIGWLLPENPKLSMLDSSTVVFPIVHPAAGMHNPDQACYVVSGFQRLAMYLQGQVEPRILFDDPIKEPRYEEITTEVRLREVLRGLRQANTDGHQDRTTLSIDTEGWPHNPWSLQFSYEAGQAYLIRATNRILLRRFGESVHRARPRLAYHSALHDLGMLRVLGVDLDGLAFDDTMIQAYLLQIEPKGLKAACLRHCGMKMQDYSELVAEPSERIVRDYLTWLWDGEQHDYDVRCQAEFERRKTEVWTDKKGKTCTGCRISKIPALPKTPLHKAVTRILQSKRPRGLWEDQIEDIHVAAYHRLGDMPDATLDFVEPTVAVAYGCRDADGTTRLLPEYRQRIEGMGLRDVYQLELRTYPLLDRMQRIGIKPDLDHFSKLSNQLGDEIGRLRADLVAQTGNPEFNANSGDQVAAYLFDTLGLDEVKMTKGGRGSTNDKILEALEHEHPEYPVISVIREYRETYKLLHTFVSRIPDFVHRWPYDGRIHTTLRTTSVVTGRLAASDPNLLAQPEHGAFASDFKRGWIADEGHVLYSADESQIELRGLAHMSQDPVLCDAFRKGIDLHALLAQRIFGVAPKNQDKHKHRYPAKTIHYLMAMGGTAKGLQVQLRANGMFVSEDDAQRWLDDTFGLYEGTKRFIEACIEEARRYGYVRGLSGRIRYIGGINSRDERIRAEAERFTYSFKIQESASAIMKAAEATIWEDVLPHFWTQGVYVEPLLQVHDSLRFECDEAVVRDLHTYVSDAMTNVPNSFNVPLAVEAECGYNLADTEKL